MPFFKKAQSDRSQPKVTTLKLPWTKKIKPEVIAFTIDNVMTKEECDAWIAETEEQGYQFALLNTGVGQVYDPEHRNSKRCIQGIFFGQNFLIPVWFLLRLFQNKKRPFERSPSLEIELLQKSKKGSILLQLFLVRVSQIFGDFPATVFVYNFIIHHNETPFEPFASL